MPVELDEVKRKITQLKIEQMAIKKDSDPTSLKRLKEIEIELEKLEYKDSELTNQWNEERKELAEQKNLKAILDTKKFELEQAFSNGNYEKASKLQYDEIPSIENRIKSFENRLKDNSLLSESVTEDEIAKVISKATNIPVSKLMQGDREKVLSLAETLRKRVIGQDEAIELVSDAIIRQRAGIKDEFRPIGSFLFLGPTGVGKTELAKALAEALFDSESHIVRIDMSEYGESHSVAKLIGAPPGYIGYDDAGQLTEPIRRNPYSIVLFDEIEKAHKDIFNVLLQILDDGRLTDSQGRTVDFKNTIIIMTSNLGSDILLENPNNKNGVINILKNNFKPEFLNRIDETIVFKPLEKDIQLKIINKLLSELDTRLLSQEITIKYSDNLKNYILDQSFDITYGARPIRRYIQKLIETYIATNIIKGNIKPNILYTLDVENDNLILKNENEA